MVCTICKGAKGESEIGSRMGGGAAGWIAGFIVDSSISATMWARRATHGRMEEKLMPDFDTRTPQGSNEPNRPRMTSITNRLSSLLSASKFRILSIASALRRSVIASRYRSLFVGGVLLFAVAAPVGLLIYSFGGFDHLQQMVIQQETRTIPGMQKSHMGNIRIDENQKGKLVFQLSGPYRTPLNYAISNMNANGSSLEQLTDTVDKRRMGYTSEDPARSPDLKRIAFTRPASQYPASVDASHLPPHLLQQDLLGHRPYWCLTFSS